MMNKVEIMFLIYMLHIEGFEVMMILNEREIFRPIKRTLLTKASFFVVLED